MSSISKDKSMVKALKQVTPEAIIIDYTKE